MYSEGDLYRNDLGGWGHVGLLQLTEDCRVSTIEAGTKKRQSRTENKEEEEERDKQMLRYSSCVGVCVYFSLISD